MKLLGKYLVYSLIIVLLTVGSVLLIKNHPEVQLVFLLPGLFIVLYSLICNELMVRPARAIRGR